MNILMVRTKVNLWFYKLLRIKHGSFRDFLDEVGGDFFAEVEGVGETQDFMTQGTRRRMLGGVDVGLEAIHNLGS
jgi:hypothetical protein